MPTDESAPGAPRPATSEIFARFIDDQSRGIPRDFDALCAEHPELADSLRKHFEDWRRYAPVFERLRGNEPLQEKLDRTLGAGVVPAITLESTSPSDEPPAPAERLGATSRLYEELKSRQVLARRYEIRGEIKTGGMGVVLRAWDEDLRRSLAMKVMRDDQQPGSSHPAKEAERRDLLRRFLEEAQVTAQLDHPGVVPVHDMGIDATGRPFFTMKLVKGRDLKEIFALVRDEKEGWTLARALGVMLKVCEAIAFAHDKGVIHRDLKPANVMVGRFGETFVMDWGLARIVAPNTPAPAELVADGAPERSQIRSVRREDAEAGTDTSPYTVRGHALGTPAYMSPEQALGFVERLGPRTDIYSAGAMLYQLLAGHPPYVPPDAKLTAPEVLMKVAQGPPPPLRTIAPRAPVELVAICEKAMQRDDRRRYASALEIARDIEAYLGSRPVAAHEPSLSHVLKLAIRRNLAVTITGACAAVLLGALLVIFITRLQASSRENERLADLTSSRVLLEDEQRSLTPLVPRTDTATQRWLDRSSALLARLPAYRAEIASARTPDPPFSKDDLALVVARMETLSARAPIVAAALADARSLARRTVQDEAPAWDRALASLKADARFTGLALAPQIGFVPLGQNPTTGLWEFWHVQSGARPERDDRGPGYFRMQPGAGMVFVLLPGGTFTMGSREEDIRAGRAQEQEKQRLVALKPFLVSKYEVTQDQWLRVVGNNPSRQQPGIVAWGTTFDVTHPVESIRFEDASRFSAMLDLQIPTEAQFEFACRAGDYESLKLPLFDESANWPRENVADESQGSERNQDVAHWSDGFHYHAPVGTFLPNAYGLFDMLGNVSEWSRDRYTNRPATSPDDDGDGLDSEVQSLYRVIRGGNWILELKLNRPAFRIAEHESNYSGDWLGARMARRWRNNGR